MIFVMRRARRRTSERPKSCRRKRTRGAVSTTRWCATSGRRAPCRGTWPPADRCATCRRNWTPPHRIRTTRSTRTWSSVRTATGRSTRRPPNGTYRCALNVSGTRPPGNRTKNGERRPLTTNGCHPPPPTDTVCPNFSESHCLLFFPVTSTTLLRPIAQHFLTDNLVRILHFVSSRKTRKSLSGCHPPVEFDFDPTRCTIFVCYKKTQWRAIHVRKCTYAQ